MKLYWSPGACSQAPHILLHEIGLDHEAVRVDLRTKKLEDGSDYLAINPKGAVPALQLDSGEVLTENAVILQYLGDRASWPEILPPQGDFRRYRVLEMVNFIDQRLGEGPFLFGDDLTLPDAYLFVITGWAEKMIGLDKWPNLRSFRERMMQRRSVRHVLRF